jgi:hypothetical protein
MGPLQARPSARGGLLGRSHPWGARVRPACAALRTRHHDLAEKMLLRFLG